MGGRTVNHRIAKRNDRARALAGLRQEKEEEKITQTQAQRRHRDRLRGHLQENRIDGVVRRGQVRLPRDLRVPGSDAQEKVEVPHQARVIPK